MSDDEEVDLLDVAKQVLIWLLQGKTPEDCQAELVKQGASAEDAEVVVNITALTTQSCMPVVEEGADSSTAVKALTDQGIEEPMAEALVNMVLTTIQEQEASQNEAVTEGVEGAPQAEQVVNEDELRILMRLAAAVNADLSSGTPKEVVAEALSKVDGIQSIEPVAANIPEFVDYVMVAKQSAERIREGQTPENVMKQAGMESFPGYVPLLTLFFVKAPDLS